MITNTERQVEPIRQADRRLAEHGIAVLFGIAQPIIREGAARQEKRGLAVGGAGRVGQRICQRYAVRIVIHVLHIPASRIGELTRVRKELGKRAPVRASNGFLVPVVEAANPADPITAAGNLNLFAENVEPRTYQVRHDFIVGAVPVVDDIRFHFSV